MTINNQQSTKNKGSKKTWFQRWIPKIARAFSLDATQESQAFKMMSRATGWDAPQGAGEQRTEMYEQYFEGAAQPATPWSAQSSNGAAGSASRQVTAARGSRGDTIVEVILATALIASAITLTYSMSNHNLSNGVSAGQRSQALSLAGAQIERIKNAYITNSPALSSYKTNKAFCILNDGSEEDVAKLNSKCVNFGSSPYSVTVNYKSTTLVFKADISWFSSSNNSGQDQLTLYYKLPG